MIRIIFGIILISIAAFVVIVLIVTALRNIKKYDKTISNSLKKEILNKLFYFLIVILISFWGYNMTIRGFAQRNLNKNFLETHIEDFTNFGKLGQFNGNPYINGKIIIIDITRYYVSRKFLGDRGTKGENDKDTTYNTDIYIKLPRRLHAMMPEEVGTVIWLRWYSSSLAYYVGGMQVKQIFCNMTIIDITKKPKIVLVKTFSGSAPSTPRTKSVQKGTKGSDEWGSYPKNQIKRFIRRLPQKTGK